MAQRRRRAARVEQTTEAVGYVRVSTNEQADTGLSLDAQRARLEAQAVANGWKLVAVYEDAGLSAKTLERAGLRAAFDALRPGRVLLAVRLDRLTRSVPDLYTLDAEVTARGAEWATVAERIDTSTATGRMMRTLLATIAEWEREIIAERTSAALLAKRARGERLGTTPLGYQTVRDADGVARLLVDEAEQETVALARRLRSDGWTYQRIAECLAAEGRPTKRGGVWDASRVRAIVPPSPNTSPRSAPLSAWTTPRPRASESPSPKGKVRPPPPQKETLRACYEEARNHRNTRGQNMTTRRSHIYALLEPTTYQPRYVGRTGSSLPKRLGQHLADSKLREPTRLAGWLRELAAQGQRPLIALLESVPDADWRQAERDAIARLRAEGAALVNTDEGGTGPAGGYRWSEDSVEKMRRPKAGRARGGSSACPGVSRHGATGRWRAQLCGVGLGLYDSEEEASLTYLAGYRERFDAEPQGWEGWTPAEALGEIGKPRPEPKALLVTVSNALDADA